jgi:hypothetical protein
MSGPIRRRTLLHVCLALMAACCVAWMLWALFGPAGPPLPLTLVVLTLLIQFSLVFSRWLRGLDLKPKLHRGLTLGAFAFVALLVMSGGFYNRYGVLGGGWWNRLLQNDLSGDTFFNQNTSLLIVAVCWWAGRQLGDMLLTSTHLLRFFYLCLLVLAVSSITSTLFVHDTFRDAPWLFFVLLFTGLLMLGLGRVEEAARRSQSEGAPFTFYWLGQIGLTAGVLIGLLLVALALRLQHGFGLILALVTPALAALVYPAAFIGARVIALGLESLAPAAETVVESPDPTGSSVAQTPDPNSFEAVCVGLFTLFFFALIVTALVYGSRRWKQMLQDQEEAEGQALPSVGQRVSDAVENRLERLGLSLPGMDRLRRRLAARSVRRIYAALLALGAEQGYPRAAARTPYEHLAALKQAFPRGEAQVERITEAYVAVHYGEAPESRAALQEIKTAWEQVREGAERVAPMRSQTTERQMMA